ncbi:hypothetical protein PGT21_000164 [Puccinia graminis f. sp. tritici]|uniref:Uncharacterized protein n=1 Tax=Puccinia graminis f. sp. tritici TaxID=56615 RepID=A0A5B0NCN8_PUCGR|nr:hypothetical protein PGT21_000164 [Puccinia graminis f. sp. tritici]
MGAADRSAAPRRSTQPGGCRSFCSPQTISSAWGLQIDLQPPDDLHSLGAADRSAAPRRSPQPGGCRSFCNPPPPPAHQAPPYVESSRATRRRKTICSPRLRAADRSAALSSPFSLRAADLSAALSSPFSLRAADRSAALSLGLQKSICSPQSEAAEIDLQPSPLSAWGLQIDLQPPPPLLSLGAADRSAAPR